MKYGLVGFCRSGCVSDVIRRSVKLEGADFEKIMREFRSIYTNSFFLIIFLKFYKILQIVLGANNIKIFFWIINLNKELIKLRICQ